MSGNENTKKMSGNENPKIVSNQADVCREAKQFPLVEPGVEGLSDYFNRTSSVMRLHQRHAAGLENSGCDCFLNSILQLVVHTPQLAGMILETSDRRVCRGRYPCPHCELRKHIIRVTSSSLRPVRAITMRQILPLIFPAHIDGYQEDAHEMLTLLLDSLDPPPAARKPESPAKPASRMEKLVAESTPIQQIFGGCLKNEITCDECHKVHINFERVLDLSLGIPECGLPTNSVSLKSVLEANFREERIDSFQCDGCNAKVEAVKRSSIMRAPSILIVQLKRFDAYGQKNRFPVTPDISLSLEDFASGTSGCDKKSKLNYRLEGVIQHIGRGLESGHYISAMRGFDRVSWYLFDDSTVTPRSDERVQKMEPYIAVYAKCDEEKTFARRASLSPEQLWKPAMRIEDRRSV